MKDFEFRYMEEYLKNSGVECYRFMDQSKVESLKQSGAEILFYSFFGENPFTGDCETILLVRKKFDSPPSPTLLHIVRKFGQELVCREKASGGASTQ
ncbi:MAG: hypothetical protein R2940_01725 [Syntrophotaleaceae bacterium]